MLKLLKPKQSVRSIYQIDLDDLHTQGYRHMIIDIDNTLTPWNDHQTGPDLVKWIAAVREKGFSICLLSNNQQKKVRDFAARLGVLAAPKGGKPSSRAFERALTVLQGSKEDTLVIGDQIFTDILGGNRWGLYTILVDPITTDEFIGTRFTRLMEKLIAGRRTHGDDDHS